MKKLKYRMTIVFEKEMEEAPTDEQRANFAAECYVPVMRFTDAYFKKPIPIVSKMFPLELRNVTVVDIKEEKK